MRDVVDFYPLTPLQEGLLFHSLAASDADLYFNQCILELRGPLAADTLRRAWQLLVDRHPVLRTFFVWKDLEAPVQAVARGVTMPFRQHDLRGLSAERQSRSMDSLLERLRGTGFELARPPLARVDLLRTDEDAWEMVWSYHHLLLDGRSTFLVLEELFGLYDDLVRGDELRPSSSPPFRRYVAWLGSRSAEGARRLWSEALDGTERAGPLPGDRGSDAPEKEELAGGSVQAELGADTVAALEDTARRWRVTPNAVLQTAWAVVLSRYTGSESVLFGTVLACRPPDLDRAESMIGPLINTLPVPARIPRSDRPRNVAARLQRWFLELQDRAHDRLVDVRRWSGIRGSGSLFDSIVMYENYWRGRPLEEMSETLVIGNPRWHERTSYPVAVLLLPGDGLTVRVLHDRRRFDEVAVGMMLEHLHTVLRSVAGGGDGTIGDLRMASPERRLVCLAELNDTATPYPRERCIHELFVEQAARRPHAIAVEGGERRLTYGDLDARSDELARYLGSRDVGPESRVAVCMEPSIDLVVALLGILKAGGAYVPLDPDDPAARLAAVAEKARVELVLTEEHLRERLAVLAVPEVCLDDEDRVAIDADVEPRIPSSPDNLAYVMFTSGSTGRPKAVAAVHRGVVRLVRETSYVDLGPHRTLLHMAPLAFDASTFEIWGALLNGARLVLPGDRSVSPRRLGELIRRHGVDTVWLTAGLFHEIVDTLPEALEGIEQLLAGGDVLGPAPVDRFLQLAGERRLVNGYGPTENTTFSCCHRMDVRRAGHMTVPIGRPIANSRAYVLDTDLEPVAPGVPGELYVAGDGLARGYDGQPRATASRFLPDPFAERPGARMYRTGDRARILADGNLEFLGRVDDQVKVRGYRIEPGEIEATLERHPEVTRCAVVCQGEDAADRRLQAHYVSVDGDGPSPAALRAYLRERLPDYMVPTTFVRQSSLPLNANGKVDRGALRSSPDGAGPASTTTTRRESWTPTQRAVGRLWREVLRVDEVELDDNFFDLGGHSLLVIRVHHRIEELAGRPVPMVELFRHPTVRDLAALLEGSDSATRPVERKGSASGEGSARPRDGDQDAMARRDMLYRRRRRLPPRET